MLIDNGSGSFANVAPQVLPHVADEGVVLDFVVLDADRDGVNEIYVLRTSGGDGTLYQSRTVQKVTWPARASTVLSSQRNAQWIPWLLPVFSGGRYTLTSDVTQQPFTVPL